MQKPKDENATIRAAQWSCLGTVLAAVLGAIIAGLFTLINVPNEQGISQPLILNIIQPILKSQNYIVTVVTTTPNPSPVQANSAEAGSVLYQADWSNGSNGWPMTFGWQVLTGTLVNDGSNVDNTSGGWKINWIAAPYEPTSPDYRVEADIQLVSVGNCGSFGIVARSGYEAGVHHCYGGESIALNGEQADRHIGERQFVAGTDWHTYSIRADGNTYQVLVDGAVMINSVDNRHLSSGQVGLWADRVQINVRNFRV
jgi:hypothetical protein